MKPKKIKLTPDEMNYGLFEKHEYRGYEIRVYNTKANGVSGFYGINLSCGNPAKTIEFDYENDNAEAVVEEAVEAIDRKLDSPKEARKRLKASDTQTLLNIFYNYAISAPAWADEVMGMVAERKKRAWLITQIEDMLDDDELIEEMGV